MNSGEQQSDAMTNKDRNAGVSQALSTFTETFGLTRTAAIGVILFVSVVILAGVFWFIHSAPPRTLIITSGPPGSSFERTAEKYRDLLSSNGVTVKILTSEGSLENLRRLENSKFRVDVGLVQTGEFAGSQSDKLFSLGTV